MSFWDELTDRLSGIGSDVAEWGVKILLALAVLVIGRWILAFVRRWVRKLLETPAATTVFDKAGISGAMQPTGRSAAGITATVIYALLLVVLWLIVARILDVPPIVDLLERLLAVLPLIVVAVALVVIAAAVGSFVADLVRPFAEQRNLGWLTTAVRVFILLFGVLAALDLLEIRFAEDIVKIVTAAAGVALAIAFGIGGIDTAKQWWARYASPRQQ
ncbi:MAG: hypothetical protein KJN71_08425 [Acidimicrobiia bacterium]|nr:hypothetical protein [Acidimicrobiia bacterium]MBT8215169.1 hypothetical protein [Acidimicrobiia bacterium]